MMFFLRKKKNSSAIFPLEGAAGDRRLSFFVKFFPLVFLVVFFFKVEVCPSSSRVYAGF